MPGRKSADGNHNLQKFEVAQTVSFAVQRGFLRCFHTLNSSSCYRDEAKRSAERSRAGASEVKNGLRGTSP